jgi:hypothetical protein
MVAIWAVDEMFAEHWRSMFIVIISCLLAKNANGENRDWGRGPLLQLFRSHELEVCLEFSPPMCETRNRHRQ